MKNIWTILCRSATVDKETNNVSIERALERLEVSLPQEIITHAQKEKKPILVPFEYTLVSLWAKDIKEEAKQIKKEAKLSLFAPDGQVLNEISIMMEIDKKKRRTRLIINSTVLPIVGSGDYLFRITLKGSSPDGVAEVPLEVVLRGEN